MALREGVAFYVTPFLLFEIYVNYVLVCSFECNKNLRLV